jgi:CYTH domain-containing protein
MPTEIERKFLVKNNSWKHEAAVMSRRLDYGYLKSPDKTVCLRQITFYKGINPIDKEGELNIKSKEANISREETEIKIDADNITLAIAVLPHKISKQRFFVDRWEIDTYFAQHTGLVLAEIELASEDEEFDRPSWLGEEVTGNIKYYNEYLSGALGGKHTKGEQR